MASPSRTRTLLVVRHAQAEDGGRTDAERRLSERGGEDAAALGRWLVAQGVEPDAALVSAATRTQMTWESLAEAAGYDPDVELDEGLYTAGPETALDLVRATDDAVETLVVVGHNPTMGYLAQLLDDGEGDEEASAAMATGFPTAAVAVLRLEGDWEDLDEAGASVTAFHVARA